MKKQVTIEVVVSKNCHDCKNYNDALDCVSFIETMELLGLPGCIDTNHIYKIKESEENENNS